MEIKSFYRTQRDLATALKQLVDAYWNEEITEEFLIDGIQSMYKNNEEKLIKGHTYTTIVQQQCGKRRMAVVSKVLDLTNVE
ncbi:MULTISPECIES: TIGR04540 family protein [Heyndrickxia]|uniref:TIGR04540 family protein n=1 Tax=Heyndrickxia TaxID=2837504 RepID=UPI002DBFF717|nr:TIGR04540 family protein [Weizmannia sp. CD-2023]MEC2303576.1 TIGR04540 family protein [Weizmannia sp. CD-2023]MEC2340516.1 TIGR04540 family protein [Weizmannia sp. CD-2023]